MKQNVLAVLFIIRVWKGKVEQILDESLKNRLYFVLITINIWKIMLLKILYNVNGKILHVYSIGIRTLQQMDAH